MKAAAIHRYDPRAPRDLSPLRVGRHTVTRRRLPGSPHTLYCVTDGLREVGRQVSMPSAADCEALLRMAQDRARAAARAAHPLVIRKKGDLTEAIVRLLQTEQLGLGEISARLAVNPNVVSPILSRLTSEQRLQRRGARRKYVYHATA